MRFYGWSIWILLIAIQLGCESNSWQSQAETEKLGDDSSSGPDRRLIRSYLQTNPRSFSLEYSPVTLWWDRVPTEIMHECSVSGETSNIALDAYAGPDTCQKCHQENYQAWSEHPHRWMNALANDETIVGDFSGEAEIHYLGGVGTFYIEDGQHRMRLRRDDIQRV